MSEAFVGIVAFFFANGRKHKATLAVRNIYGSHSGSNIVDIVTEVLAEWKIDKAKLGKVLTDNGSNMLKAFRMIAIDTSPEVLDDSDDDDCVIDDLTGDIDMEEEDEFDDDDTNSDDEDEDEKHQSDVIAEVNECELRESECNLAFCSADYERLSCFPHTLQLVVSKFDEVGACKQAIKSSKKLVAKVNKSVKATEMLKSSSGVKLIGDCPTRWSSTFLMLKQLLHVRSHLEDVLRRLNWDNLATKHWKTIENVVELLKPFAEYTDLSGGENFTTISSIIPIIMELRLHLDQVCKY